MHCDNCKGEKSFTSKDMTKYARTVVKICEYLQVCTLAGLLLIFLSI
jgi:hypothetical protein